ncbi:protein translocase subunit SecF [Gallaecimonas pentaromativorans]|uniref:Protein-export membrane protein SecF n=1 Tax=Gallaecimonas pentaromativorans TaxID=584787 RepID=A0A3N1PNG0_9GAMM|nr:protein translocase subunit SecF [Gallaecimonas pentaromativorans]MED5524672.1 protein translocase subunit SecF [Pseudomonadota bacterium]ROQ28661.1 protein translocase subunit secF [Gallaecimonas pentaromativorans]
MQFFNFKSDVNFMKMRLPAAILSLVLVASSIGVLVVKGLSWGLDFTGGTLIEVNFARPADLEKVRSELQQSGFGEPSVQFFGTSRDVLIRMPPQDEAKSSSLGDRLVANLKAKSGDDVTLKRIEFVGPSVGNELVEQGGLAVFVALLCILLYVSVRFEWKLALGSVVALFHDVTITLGFFSLLGIEFDLTVLAAVLTVIGYSLNDTIVVFDRIRENFRKMRKGTPIEITNNALTFTLSRTIMTSATTLFVVIAIFAVGGPVIHAFAAALLMGITVGTYSSIYVASAVALKMGLSKEDLMPTVVEKEGADLDPLP